MLHEAFHIQQDDGKKSSLSVLAETVSIGLPAAVFGTDIVIQNNEFVNDRAAYAGSRTGQQPQRINVAGTKHVKELYKPKRTGITQKARLYILF